MRDGLDAMVAVLNQRSNATMAELAEAAGISRATLHRRFPTRDHLLSRIAEEAAVAAERAVVDARIADGSASEACARLVANLVPLGGRFTFLLREGSWLDELPTVAPGVKAVHGAIDEVVQRGRRTAEFRADLPFTYQARLVLVAVLTAWEAVQAGELGRKEAPRAAATALLAGVEVDHDSV